MFLRMHEVWLKKKKKKTRKEARDVGRDALISSLWGFRDRRMEGS